jgi:hypothetical protein
MNRAITFSLLRQANPGNCVYVGNFQPGHSRFRVSRGLNFLKQSLSWETLEIRRDYYNRTAPNLNNLFLKISKICPISYNLRNSDTDLVLPVTMSEMLNVMFVTN